MVRAILSREMGKKLHLDNYLVKYSRQTAGCVNDCIKKPEAEAIVQPPAFVWTMNI